MKVTTSLPESRSTESVSSTSYYLKGAAVILGTGATYAVAKATGVWSWIWSGLGAVALTAEDKALQTSISVVQVREGGDLLSTATLSSQTESPRVEELDSLELVDLDQKSNHAAAAESDNSDDVIEIDTRKIGRKLLMTPDAEFVVNTYTLSNQSDPAVAVSPDGGFVLSWTSYLEDGSGDGVYAQVFNASAMRVGSEFRANTYTTSDQNESAIAVAQDGSFYITWASNQDVDSIPLTNPCAYLTLCSYEWCNSNCGIYYSYYNAIPACTFGSYGYGPGSPYTLNMNEISLGIYSNHFPNSNNTIVIGIESQINTYPMNNQQNPSITTFQNGDVLIVWESSGSFSYSYTCTYTFSSCSGLCTYRDIFSGATISQDGSGFGIFARRFSLTENYGPDFQINSFITGDQRFPSVNSFSDGGSLVAWQSYAQDTSGWGIFAQRFGDGGGRIGTEFEVNNFVIGDQSNPAVTAFPNGGFAVVWQSWVQDNSGWGVFARLFDSSNLPLDIDFQVNTYWIGDQVSPAIASFQTGEFVVIWQSYSQDGSGFGIYGQRFSAQGVPFQNEFQLNTYTSGDQANPAIASWGTTGDFIVSWDSYLQDGSGTAVIARVYYNDVLPTLSYANPFNMIQHGNISVTSALFNITGDHPSNQLTITISNLQHAEFQLRGEAVTQFSQQDIENGQVVLLQDGSAETPAFNFTGSDGFTSIGPIAANVSFTITQSPNIVNNNFYILQGHTQPVMLSNLSAFDPRLGITSADLVFNITVTGGQFSLVSAPDQAIKTFTEAQINSSQIQFTHTGGELIPAGSVRVGDSFLSSSPQSLQMSFDAAPTIINDRLTLKPGDQIVLTSSDVLTSDDRTLSPELILSVSNVTEGYFSDIDAVDEEISLFTQEDINLQKILFTHNGGHIAPGFFLTVTDNAGLTAGPQSAQIIFDDPSAAAVTSSYRNTLIYAVISGTIGLGFFAFKFWMSYKGARYLENAIASESGDQAYQKRVIKPIAKEILAHVKMTGFLGYVKDRTMRQAYAAIVGLVRECAAQGVEVDLRKLSDASQTFLIATIAQKTRDELVPPVSCCSTAYAVSFFRPEVTPAQITGKKSEIATAVKTAVGRQSIVEPETEIKTPVVNESKKMMSKKDVRSDDTDDIELQAVDNRSSDTQPREGETAQSHHSPRLLGARQRSSSFEERVTQQLAALQAQVSALASSSPAAS